MKRWIPLFFLIAFLQPYASQAKGTFSHVKGQVLLKNGDGEEKEARRGMTIQPGDQVRTEKASFAKVTMADKNVFHIGPDSAVVFNQYETEGENQDSVLSVLYGRLHSGLEGKYDEKSRRFRVNTKSAILGVRGTDFLTSYSQVTGQSRVITFEGLVEVSGLNEQGEVIGTQELQPGQMTLVGLGQSPLEPLVLPAGQLQKFQESSESEDTHSMEEAATAKETASVVGLQAVEVPSVDPDEGTYDVVDKKLVGDSQGQFVRFIFIDDED